MRIVGTAGHVDHGKSALVRALTDTDPDRLIEERRRGMTLDLGFAHLRFADGEEAGIVDVPGHERFLHNMLAGAAGMDVLLLVVAANEGPRPQTLEHLAILEYLNVRRTIVVLSKADLVDEAELTVARDLVTDATKATFAADAPVLPVSASTGRGIDALKLAIHDALVAVPERAPNAPPYLPIDRVFALAGHGTVVTGTLMQGRIAVGDELTLVPRERGVRVRGLQVFGEKRAEARGGTRVALNLAALETAATRRGDVIASAELPVAATLDVDFRAWGPALGALRRRNAVRAYVGSAELLGTLRLERMPANANDTVNASLHLRTPTLAVPGASYVVRRLSPKTLLGGGTFAGSEAVATAPLLDEAPETPSLLAALRKLGLDGADAARAGGLANIRAERAEIVLDRLAHEGRALPVKRPDAYLDMTVANDYFARATDALEASERAAPWLQGLTSIALARALDLPEAKLVRVLAAFVAKASLEYRNGYYTTPGFTPQLEPAQVAFFRDLTAGDVAVPNAPVPFVTLAGGLRAAPVSGASGAFETLLANGSLVRVGEHVYREDQIARIRALLEAKLRAEGSITVSTFREIAGISRKFAVPLIEWFDAAGVTVRSGDVRMLRATTRA